MTLIESIRLLLFTSILICFSYLLLWKIEFDKKIVSSRETDWSFGTNANNPLPTPLSYPIRRDGTIFVSNAAHGSCRDSTYKLSEVGFQVVVGVKDLAERSSYLYSIRKGMELTNFSLSDPSLYPPLIYRLRQIRRDLDRPYVGVLINLQPLLLELGLKKMNLLDLNHIDELYRVHFKSPMRLIQASLELNRHQSRDHNYKRRSNSLNEINLLTNDTNPHSSNLNRSQEQLLDEVWDAGAFRIVLLATDYSHETKCSAICLMQNMFVDFTKLLVSPQSNLVRNISLSVIYDPPSSASEQPLSYEQSIDWVIDPTVNSKEEEEAKEGVVRSKELISGAIVHAFTSRQPIELYSIYSEAAQSTR